MSMMDNILGMGRYGSVNESWEPELRNDDFDSIEALPSGVDPMEFMMESIFNNELNMRNLDTAIMCEEYTYLREHGTEMVYEAGTISTIIEKAKSAIEKIWNDIQKFFKNQIENFTKKSEKDFVRKYKTKASGKRAKIKSIPNLYKYTPDKIVSIAKEVMEIFDAMALEILDAARGLDRKLDDDGKTTEIDTTRQIEYIDTEKMSEDLNSGLDFFAKAIGVERKGTVDFDSGDFSSALNDSLSELREKMDMHEYEANTAITHLEALSDARKLLRPAYEKAKGNINQYLKTLKRMESVAKKFRIIPTDTSTEIHKAVRSINRLGSCTAAMNRYTLKLLNLCKSQYKAIVVSAASQYNKITDKNTTTTATAESFIEALQII